MLEFGRRPGQRWLLKSRPALDLWATARRLHAAGAGYPTPCILTHPRACGISLGGSRSSR
jgi:hypothetical protein